MWEYLVQSTENCQWVMWNLATLIVSLACIYPRRITTFQKLNVRSYYLVAERAKVPLKLKKLSQLKINSTSHFCWSVPVWKYLAQSSEIYAEKWDLYDLLLMTISFACMFFAAWYRHSQNLAFEAMRYWVLNLIILLRNVQKYLLSQAKKL